MKIRCLAALLLLLFGALGYAVAQTTPPPPCGVDYVQFFLDGTAVGPKLTAAPYSFQWNSTTVPDGTHQLVAKAYDKAGAAACDSTMPNEGVSAPVTFTVQNTLPPTVVLISNVSASSGRTYIA